MLLILDPPSMEVTISPEDAVTEGEDVELQCHLMEANPEKLISVTWFKNGEVYRYVTTSFSKIVSNRNRR